MTLVSIVVFPAVLSSAACLFRAHRVDDSIRSRRSRRNEPV